MSTRAAMGSNVQHDCFAIERESAVTRTQLDQLATEVQARTGS